MLPESESFGLLRESLLSNDIKRNKKNTNESISPPMEAEQSAALGRSLAGPLPPPAGGLCHAASVLSKWARTSGLMGI